MGALIPVGTVGQSVSESEFVLAIEIGGSHIVVATARLTQSEHAEVALHEWAHSQRRAPATAYLCQDDSLVFGDEAARRGDDDPARAVTDFARRLGDDTPFIVDGCALPAELLYAKAVSWAIDAVTDVEGVAPAALTLAHPAHWGEHRLASLREALDRQGITEITLIPAAKAAAMHLDASHPLEPGETVAVYDLGATTVESVALRKRRDGLFDIIGDAVHIDDIGGTGFDDAVLEHVVTAAELDFSRFAPLPDATHLRTAVRAAKELLSSHSDATITVPSAASSVRITRAEFEEMIVDDVDHSLEALTQAIESARLTPAALNVILLVGGSSRIPFIAQRLGDRFACPVIVDAVPEAAAVLGAARAELADFLARQPSESATDGDLDASADGEQPFSPALVGAPRPPASALKRGLSIFFGIAATAIAGAVVLGGTIALGDTGAGASGDTMRTPTESAPTLSPAYPPPPSHQPTTPSAGPPADPSPIPDPNPESAPAADSPSLRDPTRNEPTRQNPAQEQSSGVHTD